MTKHIRQPPFNNFKLFQPRDRDSPPPQNPMKVIVKRWNAVAQWRWDIGPDQDDPDDGEGDVCGICRVPYEGCCPACKMPGDDSPLSTSPPSLTLHSLPQMTLLNASFRL